MESSNYARRRNRRGNSPQTPRGETPQGGKQPAGEPRPPTCRALHIGQALCGTPPSAGTAALRYHVGAELELGGGGGGKLVVVAGREVGEEDQSQSCISAGLTLNPL